MGRDAGWLTASSALARNGYNTAPHFIYLPEVLLTKTNLSKMPKNFLKPIITLLLQFPKVYEIKTATI